MRVVWRGRCRPWRLAANCPASLDASLAKLFVSESLLAAAMDALRVCGGAGLLAECDVQRGLSDAVASIFYSGTSDMQRNIIARWLGL